MSKSGRKTAGSLGSCIPGCPAKGASQPIGQMCWRSRHEADALPGDGGISPVGWSTYKFLFSCFAYTSCLLQPAFRYQI